MNALRPRMASINNHREGATWEKWARDPEQPFSPIHRPSPCFTPHCHCAIKIYDANKQQQQRHAKSAVSGDGMGLRNKTQLLMDGNRRRINNLAERLHSGRICIFPGLFHSARVMEQRTKKLFIAVREHFLPVAIRLMSPWATTNPSLSTHNTTNEHLNLCAASNWMMKWTAKRVGWTQTDARSFLFRIFCSLHGEVHWN